MNLEWVDRAMTLTAHRRVIWTMDSSESPVLGEQAGASLQRHGSTCYHPLFVFNQFVTPRARCSRAGNDDSAHRWVIVLDPILSLRGDRIGGTFVPIPFAKPDIYGTRERHFTYLPAEVLQREIGPSLRRPVGRGRKRPVILYDGFGIAPGVGTGSAGGGRWSDGLFPRVRFIVTNMTAGPEGVVHSTMDRGTAEQWPRRVSTPSGLGCRATGSWPTGCVCLCSSWRTTLGTSFAVSVCPRPWTGPGACEADQDGRPSARHSGG